MKLRLQIGMCALALAIGFLESAAAQSLPGYQLWSYQYESAPVTGFRDIDAAGNVVGYFQDDASDPAGAHAIWIVGGSAQIVDPPGSTGDRRAFGLNDVGDIAGSFDAAGQHGFLRDATTGAFTTLDVPGTTQGTTVRGLNNLGDIAGEFTDTGGTTHGFVRMGGSYQAFDVPGASFTAARAIDDTGRVAGYFADVTGRLHGFVTDDGASITVLDRPGAFSTLVGGIGASGVLVGVSLDTAGSPEAVPARGFLYSGGTFTPLDIVGAVSTIPLAINVHGQVAGEYIDALGQHFGFVATPVPEPGRLMYLVAGLLLLPVVLVRRRRCACASACSPNSRHAPAV